MSHIAVKKAQNNALGRWETNQVKFFKGGKVFKISQQLRGKETAELDLKKMSVI